MAVGRGKVKEPEESGLSGLRTGVAAIAVLMLFFWRSPKPPPKPAAAPPRAPEQEWEPALNLYLPACHATLREKTQGLDPILQRLPSGAVVLEWPNAGKESLLFKYDPDAQTVIPMNASSKDALNFHKRCPA